MQVDEGNRAYSLAVLIDGFRSEEAQTRLNSVRKLSVIAKALGPARTRNELIPFLTGEFEDSIVTSRLGWAGLGWTGLVDCDSCLCVSFTDFVDDDDDVPAALAEELAKLVPLTGGPEFGHLLLPPLETLACVEESSIREKVGTVSMSCMEVVVIESRDSWW